MNAPESDQQPENHWPFLSIVMPCRNEEAHIEACLESVRNQSYPADRFQIIVADGRSIDATPEILARLAREDSRIIVIDNPDRIQAAGLNAAIRASRGDVIVRMDVHADYASDYLERCVEVLRETGAANVGGPARTRAKTAFQRALQAALQSPLGIGGAAYRTEHAEGFVDTLFPGCFRRDIFEKVGLFDPGAITNEDAEINQRIRQVGEKIFLSQKILVHYYPRDSYRALARQYFRYGRGRARTLLKHRRLLGIRPVIPFAFVSSAVVGALTSPTRPLVAAGAAAYGLVTLAEAIRVARHLGPRAVATAWGIFPVLHVSHGVGFAAGLVHYVRSPDWSHEPERLARRDRTNGAGRDASGVVGA